MDSYSFTSLARLRFQIVPVDKLSRDKFNYYFNELQRLQEVRLSDLSPVQGLFNPQGYPQGRIVFNFSSVADSESLLLHDFEPHRKTFGCIGVLQWEQGMDSSKIQAAKEELDKIYGSFISNYLLVFGAQESESLQNIPNVYYLKDLQVIETTICDLTSNFLEKLSVYVSSFQHVTLRSPGSIVRSNGKPNWDAPSRKISGSFEINNSEKIKLARNNGRRLKVFANFYLLTGKFKDALINVCESIVLLKQSNDSLWLASALECLAVCIMLLSYLEAPFSLPQNVTSIIESTKETPFVAFRSPSPASSPRTSMQSAVSSSTAATTNASVQAQSPLQHYSLDAVMELISKIMNRAFFYYKMTVSQGDEQVPMIVFIESNLRLIILLTLINIEGVLNFQIIRNTVNPRYSLGNKTIDQRGDLNVTQILDSISNIFGQGFKNISISQKCSVYNCLISVYSSLKMERKKSFLLKELLDVINSARLLDSKDIEYDEVTGILESLIVAYKVSSTEGSFIMQKRILILIFNFCGKLENKDGVIKYGSLLLESYHDSLTDDEQIAIFKRLKYYSNKSGVSSRYWDQNILSSFEITTSKNLEFIQGENIDALISLRNPFAYDIEIGNLEVSTRDGFSLKTIVNPKSKGLSTSVQNNVDDNTTLSIKARSISQVALCLIPLDEGKLIIEGIRADVCNCENQLFLFQGSTTTEVERWKQEEPANDLEVVQNQLSNVSLDSKVFEYKVLYKQPILSIVDVRLDDRWFMLLEGECKKFEVHLKNISDVEINQMSLSFIDSTVEPLQALLANKSLPPNEVYEIEYYLFKKQAFKILNKHEMAIIPGGKDCILNIEIWGKRGIKEAVLLLEYSHQKENNPIKFYRTISVPVNVSVYTSVELAGCDIIPLPFSMNVIKNNDNECWKYLEKMVERGYRMNDFCLLALDFNNEWNQKMEVDLFCLLKGSEKEDFQESNHLIKTYPEDTTFVDKRIIPGRRSSRILIPIRRINFSNEVLEKRIPSLRNKQFIMDYKTPQEEQKFIRNAFWYRNELLKRLKASWKIVDDESSETDDIYSGRFGEVDLRSIRFSSRMVNVLEVEKIGLHLRLVTQDGSEADVDNLKLNTFYTVCVKISNRDTHPITGLIRHIPMAKTTLNTSIDKKILYNGVLQFSINDTIAPSCSKEFEIGIVILERGEYQWGFMFDEMTGFTTGRTVLKQQHVSNEQLTMKVI